MSSSPATAIDSSRSKPVIKETSRVPRVSICLPNLNNRRYLEERLETIFAQSLTDWELIVFDNYSDDGAWEFFQEAARRDPRVRIAQAAREGMYANWNNCIRAARGEYIYVATSDDTMATDCLEKLEAALQGHSECDLAHCNLREVDESGRESADWWSTQSVFGLTSRGMVHRPHVRRAPADGLLHLCGHTVYTSVTQLLIRRSLFDRIGFFDPSWGSIGDFDWNMRASSVANSVHVPDTWGGWRRHSEQATAAAGLGSPEFLARMDKMIDRAVAAVEQSLLEHISARKLRKLLRRTRALRHFAAGITARPHTPFRRAFIGQRLLLGSWAARWYAKARCAGGEAEASPTRLILNWLEEEGIRPMLLPITPAPGETVLTPSAAANAPIEPLRC